MELYHVLNRGVEKRNIFMDDADRYRFVHGLGIFNTRSSVTNTTFILDHDFNDIVSRYSADRIVDIHAWCLMDNHYHLLLSERSDKGISNFIRKVNIGYAKYFNDRHKRSGYLFQGRTKKIHVNSDSYYMHIVNYIHFNPLDYSPRGRSWRSRAIENPLRMHQYLLKYKWSSYRDYCGSKNFPSLISMELFGTRPDLFKKHFFDYAGYDQYSLPHQLLLE